MAVDYSKEIARLEKLIATSATSITTDGVTTSFDLKEAKATLAELKRKQAGKGKISTLNLGGCW